MLFLSPTWMEPRGKPQVKDSYEKIDNLCLLFVLIDIWRIRNPDAMRFTWRKKKSNNTAPPRLLVNI